MSAEPGHLDWRSLQLEPTGSHDGGPCEHCGHLSRTVWGYVHAGGETIAAYFVQWTLDRPDHGANFDLVLGNWDESESAPGRRQFLRRAVALEYRPAGFMVIDAASRPIAQPSLAEVVLSRAQVVGQPIAEQVFAIADAVFAGDPRIEEIRQWR